MSRWNLKAKFMVGAVAISLLPVIIVTAVNYCQTQSIKTQITQAKQTGIQGIEEAEIAVQKQLTLIGIVSGAATLLSASIVLGLTHRALGSFFKAYQTSSAVVNRLLREAALDSQKIKQNELDSLETNLNLIAEELPHLLWKKEAVDAPFQVLMKITRHIWASFSEENVFRTTVEQLRQALRTDRVVVFRFDVDWEGTFVAESVAPIWPKTLWSTIKDPCFFEKNYAQMYRDGRIHINDDIYNVGLSDCHIGLLERFGVKASIIAPIIRDHQLFGLLIAHQCSGPRTWLQPEIDLFAQIATQVGFALDHAKLLQQIDATAEQAQLFTDITLRLRDFLREEDIFKTTVEEVHKALRVDRVMIYNFDSDWCGTVVAESVVPGFPKALWKRIKDPCFVEKYAQLYQSGRIQVIDNIDEAGLTDCYLQQLASFGVKAQLIAPILKDDKLFGLLIAHQCSKPRTWQQSDIDLFTQIAIQVGFALDHARLIAQIEQAYQTAQSASHQQRQHQEAFEYELSKTLHESQTTLNTLSTEALSQIELVTTTYHQLRSSADFAQGRSSIMIQQTQRQQQIVQSFHESIHQLIDNISIIQNSLIQTAEMFSFLHQPARKLSEVIDDISDTVSQIKLQTLKAEIEASRAEKANEEIVRDSSKELSSLAKKAHGSVENLEAELTHIIPLITTIQEETYEMAFKMKTELQQLNIGTQLIEQTWMLSDQLINVNDQISKLMEEFTQTTIKDLESSTSVSQSVLEIINFLRQTSEKSVLLVESFNKLGGAVKS